VYARLAVIEAGHDNPDILAVRVRASDGALLDASPGT
jgi:hypothetical protein